jgi:hypothetical protein
MADQPPTVVPNPLTINLQGQQSNDDWFKLIIVPLITSIMGLVVGGYITALTTRESAHSAKILDTQTAAYVDFANAQARYSWGDALPVMAPAAPDASGAPTPGHAKPLSPTEAANLSIHEAAIRIALFGDVKVVSKVATFMDKNTPPKACLGPDSSDLEMYATVRNRFTGETVGSQTKADIAMIFWGCHWSIAAAAEAP